MSMKIPMTPSGIEPATFRFVHSFMKGKAKGEVHLRTGHEGPEGGVEV